MLKRVPLYVGQQMGKAIYVRNRSECQQTQLIYYTPKYLGGQIKGLRIIWLIGEGEEYLRGTKPLLDNPKCGGWARIKMMGWEVVKHSRLEYYFTKIYSN